MFKLEFKTDNDAFASNLESEVAATLEWVAQWMMETARKSGPIRDHNGNTIGKFELTED